MGSRVWPGAVALCVALGACEGGFEPEPPRDAFADLRNPAIVAPVPAAPVGSSPIGAGAAPARPLRGFVQYGAPQPGGPAPGGAQSGAAPSVASGEGISLNLVGADIQSVVRSLVGEGLGGNYTIDPAVQGTVTLSTTRPLGREQILPVLEQILAMNDAAVIVTPELYRIVPRAEAGTAAPLISARDLGARGLTLRVTPLRFVNVGDLREVLESFAPSAGDIRVDPVRNLVFSIGSEAEQATIYDLIQTLDTDYLKGRSFALTPLSDADANEVVLELEAIFYGPGPGAKTGPIQFLAIERMNAVLTVSEDREFLTQAVAWMKRLDAGNGDAERLYVYEVRNRRASDLATLLGQIFGAETRAQGAEVGALAPGLGAEVSRSGDPYGDGSGGYSTGSASRGGLDAAQGEGGTGGLGGAGPVAGPGEPSLRASIEPAPGGLAGGLAPQGGAGVSRIVADESSNTLIALATPDGAKAVESALRRLDVQPLQVQIEATLAEVTLTDDLEFGVRWFFESGKTRTSFSEFANGATGAVFPGFNFVFSALDAQVALSALDDISQVRVLSSPTLMVQDNQVARLQVGDQVPVQVRSSASLDNPDALVNEIELRDTGVILTVRPTVNASGLVVMEVRQEVSDVVDTTSSGIDSPTIAQRVLESTIAVQSGETVAMGGLIRDSTDRGRAGIPVLSDIPVAGYLFGTRSRSLERTELLVLITPRVVRDQQGARSVTEELRRKLPGIYAPPVQDPLARTPGIRRLSGL